MTDDDASRFQVALNRLSLAILDAEPANVIAALALAKAIILPAVVAGEVDGRFASVLDALEQVAEAIAEIEAEEAAHA